MVHAQLLERIRKNLPCSFQDLKTILAEAVHASAEKSKQTSRDAWKDRDVQALVAQRRIMRDSTDSQSFVFQTYSAKSQGLEAGI